MNEAPVLSMKNICKKFPGVQALDDVSLELHRGEVLAIMGENGAGKSTLIKIISGALTADSGELIIDERLVLNNEPAQGIELGVSVVYQELNYFGDLSIAENLFIGSLPEKGLLKQIDYKALKMRCTEVLNKLDLHFDPMTPMNNLSIAEKQLVEITKALSKDIKILILDEPTSSLNKNEIDKLFSTIKSISNNGKGIIYISHRIDEVFQIADKVQILRDGKSVGVEDIENLTRKKIVSMMVGKDLKEMYPKQDQEIGEMVLRVENLTSEKIKNINFHVNKGEILGLFGLMGSGRTNIVEAIYGARKLDSGKIFINNKEIAINSPTDAKNNGMAYLPSDRKAEALVLEHSVMKNICLASINEKLGTWFVNPKTERQISEKWIDRIRIKTPAPSTLIKQLSGGNQQKVIVSKWLETNPKVLILNEPTRGIDVGAKVEIYKLMEDLCSTGVGILMVSSELPEIMGIADRIIVVHEGRVAGELERKEINKERILDLAFGGK